MATLTYPTQEQAAVVAERAEVLRRAYAGFTAPPPPPERKTSILALFGRFLTRSFGPEVPEFDWRDKRALPKAEYQGQCYSCTSYATAGAIEITALIANPSDPIRVSAEYLHTCIGNAGKQDAAGICGSPVDAERLLDALTKQGYALGEYPSPFPPAACSATPTSRPLAGFDVVTDAESAKKKLVKGPLIANMRVGADFFSYTTVSAPVYTPDSSASRQYAHCVCVVGFVVSGWIIRNSFGEEWGDGTGYATIAYGACGLLGAPLPGGGKGCLAYAVTL